MFSCLFGIPDKNCVKQGEYIVWVKAPIVAACAELRSCLMWRHIVQWMNEWMSGL